MTRIVTVPNFVICSSVLCYANHLRSFTEFVCCLVYDKFIRCGESIDVFDRRPRDARRDRPFRPEQKPAGSQRYVIFISLQLLLGMKFTNWMSDIDITYGSDKTKNKIISISLIMGTKRYHSCSYTGIPNIVSYYLYLNCMTKILCNVSFDLGVSIVFLQIRF